MRFRSAATPFAPSQTTRCLPRVLTSPSVQRRPSQPLTRGLQGSAGRVRDTVSAMGLAINELWPELNALPQNIHDEIGDWESGCLAFARARDHGHASHNPSTCKTLRTRLAQLAERGGEHRAVLLTTERFPRRSPLRAPGPWVLTTSPRRPTTARGTGSSSPTEALSALSRPDRASRDTGDVPRLTEALRRGLLSSDGVAVEHYPGFGATRPRWPRPASECQRTDRAGACVGPSLGGRNGVSIKAVGLGDLGGRAPPCASRGNQGGPRSGCL